MISHIEKKPLAADHRGSNSQPHLKCKSQIIVTNSKHLSATSKIVPDDMTLSCANTEIYSQARSTEAVKRELALRIKRSKTGNPRRCC